MHSLNVKDNSASGIPDSICDPQSGVLSPNGGLTPSRSIAPVLRRRLALEGLSAVRQTYALWNICLEGQDISEVGIQQLIFSRTSTRAT